MLRVSRATAIAVGTTVGASLAATLLVAIEWRLQTVGVLDERAVVDALDEESRHASALGFVATPAQRGREAGRLGGRGGVSIVSAGEECFAAIAGVVGPSPISELRVDSTDDARQRVARAPLPETADHVAHVQWCTREPGRFAVSGKVMNDLAATGLTPTWLWRVHRAPRTAELERALTMRDPTAYVDRDAVDREVATHGLVRATQERIHLAEGQVSGAAWRTEAVGVGLHELMVVPRTAATWRALDCASTRDGVTPGVAPAFRPWPSELPAEVRDSQRRAEPAPLLIPMASGLYRALALVDLGNLGARCVALSFTRLEASAAPAGVLRYSFVDGSVSLVPATGPLAVDRVCDDRGFVLYVEPAATAAPHLVQLHGLPSLGRWQPRPSTAPSGPFALPLVDTLARDCDTLRDVGACTQLADLVGAGFHSMRSVQGLLERACEIGGGEACGRLGALLARSQPDSPMTAIAFRTGCDRGDRDSCGLYGDALRRVAVSEGDFAQVLLVYEQACRNGLAGACANAEQMRRNAVGTGEGL